jgi:short-subunit dehydrogenase
MHGNTDNEEQKRTVRWSRDLKVKEMKRKTDIRDKKALITGGASGIGLATAEKLAEKGAVPILVDIDQFSLDKALSSLDAEGFEAHGFHIDITDIEGVREMARELDGQGLSPEILVNCAGLTLVAHCSATEHDEWERIINVNLMGTIYMIETFLPAMEKEGYGHIVNIGSIDGLIPIPGQAPYCASKFAITGLTEVLYFDLRQHGIGVTLVCPGYVSTPMAKSLPIKDMHTEFRGSGMLMRVFEAFSSTPQKIAEHAVEAVIANRFLVIPGLPSRIIYHYRRLFPRLATSSGLVAARIFARLRKIFPYREPLGSGL